MNIESCASGLTAVEALLVSISDTLSYSSPGAHGMRNDDNAWAGRFTCKEETDAYLGEITLHCLVCWRAGFGSLGFHLRGTHRISQAEYRERFGIPADRGLIGAGYRSEFAERRRQLERERFQAFDWDGALVALSSGAQLQDVLLTGKRRQNPGNKMPEQTAWYRRIREDPEFARRAKRATEGRPGVQIGEETLIRVEEALKQGRSIASLKSEIGTGRYSHDGLYKRRARDPAFAKRFEGLWLAPGSYSPAVKLQRAEQRLARLRPVRDRAVPFRAQEEFRQALRSDEVYGAVHAAARHLPTEIRDDVISDLIVAVLDGDIMIADLPREVGRFRTAHNRMFGGYAPSLDAPIGDGGFTLNDSIITAYF